MGTPINDPALSLHPSMIPHAYDIRYCARRHYLQIRIVGDWDVETFEGFAADYRAIIAQLRMHGGISHALVDAGDFGLQTQDVADRFPALIRATGPRSEQRSACVVPKLLNRVQARQGGDILNARYFRSVEDAADWLFSDEA